MTKQELEPFVDLKLTKGADGYPAEWCKTFRAITSPILIKCFSFLLKGGEIPSSWKQAIMSVIPKISKDKSECSSYPPTLILNLDYRLYAAIIANRLKNIIPDLIDEDQTDFRYKTQDNVRQVLHLMEHMD